jgi:NADPH-dependent ferric siderophore reductase
LKPVTVTYVNQGQIRADGALALEALRKRAAEWDVPLVEQGPNMCFRIWDSEALLQPRDGGFAIKLTAPEERLLQTLQGALTEICEENGVRIEWDAVDEGALAPGLSLMRVVSVTRRSPGFMRVRLQGPDAARLGTGSLHFRLLLPARGRTPRWPRIAASGRTVWPDGEDAMHRPVYTTAAQEADWLDFDIFRHAGSPTSDWAENDPVGQTVGVMGPGGGWCPQGSPLYLFGDQTALPAICRMLALAGGDVKAFVCAAECDLCDLAGDCRVTVVPDLVAALEATETPGGAHVWFAGHADAARTARMRLTARGLSKRDFTAAAYWS